MNIEQTYYSRENFDKLHSTVKSFIGRKYGIDVKNNFQNNLFKTMEVVEHKVGLGVPRGLEKKSYLELMNKKVLKVALSQIKEDFKNIHKPKKIIQEKFNQEKFDPRIPHPQISLKDNKMMERFEELNQMRELQPAKKVRFVNRQQDTADKNAKTKYKNLIKKRQLEEQKKEQPSELDKFFAKTMTDTKKEKFSDSTATIASSIVAFNDDNESMNNHLANINLESNIEKLIPNNVQPQVVKDIDEHMTNIHDIHSKTRSDEGIYANENFNIQHDLVKKDEENKEIFKNIMKHKETLDGSYPLIQESKIEYKERKHILTIDSIDRDLENFEDPTNFRVQFNIESNTHELIDKKIIIFDSSGKKIPVTFYKGVINYEGVRAAPVMITYKNIKSIKMCGTMMPVSKNGIYSFDEEPYFLINIPELEPTYDGTNTASNNAFAKVTTNEYTRFTNHSGENIARFALLQNMENSPFVYSPAPLANLNSLTLQVRTNRNDIYSIGNDKISVLAVQTVTNSCGPNTLRLLVRLKRFQGMNEQDMASEAINNEILYFYCKNTCYNNQYFDFEILNNNNNNNIIATIKNDYLVIKQTLCQTQYGDATINETNNIKFIHLLNKNQILQITNNTDTGFYKFTGEVDNNSIKIILISGSPIIGIITKILVSEINNKGFTSENCHDINYFKGYKILPYNIKDVKSCDSPPTLLSESTIDLNIVAGQWNSTTAPHGNNVYSLPTDKLEHENNFTTLSGTWNPNLTAMQIKDSLTDDKDDCVESYYYQTFSMVMPNNFDITNYQMDDIFFIRKRKQLSYTFEITTVEQNRGVIDTKII